MALELQSGTKGAREGPPRAATLVFLRSGRVADSERLLFTEQLALLLETGANLYSALRTLTRRSSTSAMAAVIEHLTADIAQGRTFSQALAKHPGVFSANYVNLIAASETGGFMHKVLYELKAMEEKRAELKRTLVAALSYPAFLLTFSIAVVVFILIVVFPKFGDLFTSIYDQLPVTTRALMGMSNLVLDYGVYILLALGATAVVFGRWIATSKGRETIDRLLLRLPLMRDVSAELNLVQILRVMSLSLGNGVAMVDTLRACRDVVGNSAFKKLIDHVEHTVQDGGRVAQGLEQAPFVPPIARSMISTAEESGTLARVAGRVADYYEQELTRRLNTLSRMAEPIMLVVMGAVVGLLVSSLILPIFKLARAVH